MEELVMPSPVSNSGGEIRVDLSGTGFDEAVSSSFFGDRVLLGDNVFVDSSNPASIVLKVIDQDGSYFIDPAQFSDINLDDCSEILNPRNNTSFHFIPVPLQQQDRVENYISKEHTNPPPPQASIATSLSNSGTKTPGGKLQQQTKSLESTEVQSSRKGLTLHPKQIKDCLSIGRRKPIKSISKAKKKVDNEAAVKPKLSSKDGPFHCNICQKDFPKWPSFRRHKLEHLDEKSFRCDQCPSSFNYEANLKLHGMLHEAEKSGSLQCQVCSTKLSRLASLRSHIRIHEKEENLVCAECGDEFPTKGRLEAHLDVHRTRTQQCMLHRCRLCGKSFNQAALLKDHAKEHAAVRKELKTLNTKKRKFKSNQSISPTGTSSQIPSKAEAKKLRACNVCGKLFEKPSQLQRHIRVHTGEKPFECKHCGRRFNQKGTLDSHVLATHEKVKPHVCQLCSCKFSQRGNLKAHMLKVHVTPAENENAFKCLECTCVYRRLATLNNHIAKVHAVHSYPRGLISVSKNAPKLVPMSMDPHKSIVVTTIPNTITYSMSKPKAATEQQQQGSGHTEVNKAMPLTLNQSANMIILGSGDNHPKEQQQNDDSKDKTDSQGPISEVNLIHNEQGKAGSCLVKIKKVGETKYHLCSSCSKAFRKPSDLIRHIRVHTQEKPFTCYVCDKAFAVNSTLKQHLRTHMGVKELECQTCQRRFSMLSSLRAHERLHTGAKPFPCLHCGKCFRTSGQRRIHTRVHTRNALGLTGRRKLLRIGENHPHVDLPDPLKITEDGLVVPVLNRSVHTLGAVGSTDGKPRKYKCKMCPKSFKKSSHLKQHIRSHTGERPYQCFQCQRSFVSSGVLKNHIKTHEGVRAFQCSTCKLSFTTNGSLTRHMATHSSARNFMCPHCQKKFKTSVACRKHIKTHRREIVAYSNSGSSTTDPSLPELENKNRNYSAGPETQNILNQSQVQSCLQGLSVSSFTDDDFLNGLAMDNMQSNGSLQDMQFSVQNSGSINSTAQMPALSGSINLPPQTLANSNGNVQIQQIQDANGYVTLQYTIEPQNQQIHQNVFDPSNFVLGVDSLDLPNNSQCIAAEQVEPTPSTTIQTQNGNVTESYQFYNVQSQPEPEPITSSKPEPTVSKALQVQSLHDFLDSQAAVAEAESKKEVEKIRESSRPISLKIYNELRAQEQKARQERAAESIPPGKLNQCQFCDRAFKKRSDLQRHLRIHTGEKPFKCHICSKTFRVKSTREVHMRVHTGGKSVSCHVCNNLFATKSSLRVHMRLHTNSKPYKCPHPNCERWFRTSGHRKAHIQSHFKAPRKQKPISTSNNTKTTTSVSTVHTTHVQSSSTSYTRPTGSSKVIAPPNVVVTSTQQVLPSVQVLQGKASLPSLELNNQAGTGSIPTVMTSMGDQTTTPANQVANDPNSVPLQVLNNIQLAIDGPTIQISGLDLNSLQLDENFLQNVTIFIPPMNQVQMPDILGNSNAANNILFMPTGNGQTGSAQDLSSVEMTKEEFSNMLSSSQQQSTPTFSLLNDLNLGLIPSMQNVQLSQSTHSGGNELNMDVNNMSHYVINNNAMMSSTAVSSSRDARQQSGSTGNKKASNSKCQSVAANSSNNSTDNRTCEHCSKIFSKPSLLARHARVHTGEKPFRCKICRKAFSQKSSLSAHSYVHSNEKPFSCPSCSFRTVQRAALKKHFSKAHPSEQLPEILTQDQSQQSTTKSNEILGV